MFDFDARAQSVGVMVAIILDVVAWQGLKTISFAALAQHVCLAHSAWKHICRDQAAMLTYVVACDYRTLACQGVRETSEQKGQSRAKSLNPCLAGFAIACSAPY